MASLWRASEWLARRGGTCWIVSYCASRVWGLMDLWRKIEMKEVLLVGEDQRDDSGRGRIHTVRGMREGSALPACGVGRQPVSGVPGVRACANAGRASQRAGGLLASAQSGVCVLEDPPVIIQAKLPSLTGRIQILDLRNWGIECYPTELPCAQRAAWGLGVMSRMMGVLKARGWGSLALTAGSQAMTTLRRAYLSHGMHCHTDPVASSLERAAYVGGRCECFRLGHVPGPVYHLDVRSMYPHVCSVHLLPSSLRRTGEGSLPAMWPDGTGDVPVLAEVEVSSEEAAYPATAERPCVFPVGRWVTTLAGPELTDALRLGRVRSVGRWAEYELSPCLKDYADAVFAERMRAKADGDTPIEEWLKRLSVAIVGKLGQRGWRWQYEDGIVPRGPWRAWHQVDESGEIRRVRAIGWTVQAEAKEDWSNDAVPAVAAWVCSAARVRLLEMIRTIGRENVYYCDTDSVVTSESGYCRASEALSGRLGSLGAWRVVGVYPDAEFWGQKNYRLGTRRVCAGAPSDRHASADNPDLYWYRDWLKRAAVRGQRPEVKSMLLPYRRIATYRAGVVGPGGVVHPLRRGDD